MAQTSKARSKTPKITRSKVRDPEERVRIVKEAAKGIGAKATIDFVREVRGR